MEYHFPHTERQGGWLVPILALPHEHDPNPEMRPYRQKIDAEQREQILIGVVADLKKIYEYFAPHRIAAARKQAGIIRSGPKIGRNDPCPCGQRPQIQTVLHR